MVITCVVITGVVSVAVQDVLTFVQSPMSKKCDLQLNFVVSDAMFFRFYTLHQDNRCMTCLFCLVRLIVSSILSSFLLLNAETKGGTHDSFRSCQMVGVKKKKKK